MWFYWRVFFLLFFLTLSARLMPMEPAVVRQTWKEKEKQRGGNSSFAFSGCIQPQHIMGNTFESCHKVLEPQYQSELKSEAFAVKVYSLNGFFFFFSSVRCSSYSLTLTSRRPSTNGGSSVPHCWRSMPIRWGWRYVHTPVRYEGVVLIRRFYFQFEKPFLIFFLIKLKV